VNYFWDELKIPSWFVRAVECPNVVDFSDPYATTQGGLFE